MIRRLAQKITTPGLSSVMASLMSVLCGLFFGLIIMVIFNPANAWAGFLVMLQGGFTDGMRGVGQVLYNATPLILVGIAVGFSFQTGVFNIGAIGQFTAGAYVAIAVGGILKGLTGPFHWLISLVAAGVVGVVWAILPGIMKAYMRISEIITCIMMNYVAVYLVNQLVYITHYDKTTVQSARVMRTALMPKLGLNKIFAGSSVNSGLFIAIAIAVVAYLILYKTTYGYSLRACGLNPFASRYAGINEKLNTLSVMMISGLAAGLGGGVLYLSSLTKNYVLTENFITEASYGIPVALLGNSHPIGIIFSSLFIAFIMVGGSLMQGNGFPVETVDIITAIIVYFSAVAPLFKLLINKGILNIGLKWAKGEGKAREVDN